MKVLLKNIFTDTLKVYKNFFHWNVSKLLIFVSSFLLACIFVLPLVLLMIFYGFFAGLNFFDLIIQLFSKSLGTDGIINIFLYLISLLFFVVSLYGYVLLIKLNLSYLKGEKLKYLKNYYFNFSKIKTYFGITFFNFLILLIPIIFFIIVFSILIGILILLYGSIEGATEYINNGEINFITITSIIALVISIISFIYLFFRVYFSYFIFIDDNNKDKEIFCLGYIKKSFKKTKGVKKFFKFLLISSIFFIFLIPSGMLIQKYKSEIYNLNYYVNYNILSSEEKQPYLKLNSNYIQSLELEYSKMTSKDLVIVNIKNYSFLILLYIFEFLVLFGVYQMILTSFYRHELLKK